MAWTIKTGGRYNRIHRTENSQLNITGNWVYAVALLHLQQAISGLDPLRLTMEIQTVGPTLENWKNRT